MSKKDEQFDLFSGSETQATNNDLWGATPPAADIFANFQPAKDIFGNAPQTEEKSNVVPITQASGAAPVVPIKPQATASTSGTKGADKPATEAKKPDAKKPEAKKGAKKPEKKKVADVVVDPTWTIAYAAQQSNPPHENMKLEDLRAYLELDYPELSKERTKWEFDEEKKLAVPIVSGGKMG